VLSSNICALIRVDEISIIGQSSVRVCERVASMTATQVGEEYRERRRICAAVKTASDYWVTYWSWNFQKHRAVRGCIVSMAWFWWPSGTRFLAHPWAVSPWGKRLVQHHVIGTPQLLLVVFLGISACTLHSASFGQCWKAEAEASS